MLIGELAKVTTTTARALRHYEEAGLISSERAPNGYRVYDERTAVRVRNIRYLLAAGLTLDDVRVFAPCLDGNVAAAAPSAKGCASRWSGSRCSTNASPPRPRPATDWPRHCGRQRATSPGR